MELKHVRHLWRDDEASSLRGLDRLVYRSNALGADLTLTNTGGGNTSSKLAERDPLTGAEVEVLWVKGSGGDLRTAKADGFASLYLDRVRAMRARYLAEPARGPKTPIEDLMYDLYGHCVFNLNPRACSIDTPLHTFVPFKHVDHLHPNAVIAVAASVNQERLCREIYGDDVAYVPWQRPGFDLGLLIEARIKEKPGARGVLLGHHGMSSWSNDDKACYETALEIVDRAAAYIAERDRGERTFGGQRHAALPDEQRRSVLREILPWLRGRVSADHRLVATVQDDPKTLRFTGSIDGPRLAALGTSCPDHFLRTKIKPLFADWDPASRDLEALKAALSEGLERYRRDYAAYYDRRKRKGSPAMRDANPTVVSDDEHRAISADRPVRNRRALPPDRPEKPVGNRFGALHQRLAAPHRGTQPTLGKSLRERRPLDLADRRLGDVVLRNGQHVARRDADPFEDGEPHAAQQVYEVRLCFT
jgi:rhamnulose-1-phosphate aldolase/alcohol dehydrogenase